MIPRIFHQVWVGPEPFPTEFAAYQESWRRHHPEWELRFWTDANLPQGLRRDEVYDETRVAAERSDIVRLELLWLYGGVYIDTDMECRRPIDGMLDGVEFFTVYIKPGRITNTVIGSAPGHPLLDRALNELTAQQPGAPFDKTASGPLFLDKLVQASPGMTIFESAQFFPSTPEEQEQAVAIHHSARSWKDREGWRDTALRAEARLAKATRQLEEERAAHERTKAAVRQLKEDVQTLKARVKQSAKTRADEPAPASEEDADRRPALSFRRSRARGI